jgi:transmembrane sensor
MEDNTKEDHDLLFKVLEGKALESEHRKFNEWLEKSAANREFFEELKAMRQSVLLEQSSYDTSQALTRMRAAMEKNSNPVPIPRHTWADRSRQRRHRWVLSAFALLFLSVSLFIGDLLRKRTPEFTGKLYQTSPGQQLEIQLEDGSAIHLNGASQVQLEKDFNDDTREVFLTGEAFFKVSHNPDRPFIVHTETIHTKVLGTAFNVRAYRDDTDVHVTVESGKVGVGLGKQELSTLMRGQDLLYDKKQLQWKVHTGVNIDLYTGWRNDLLLFEDATLETIIHSMERHYGIETTHWENAAVKNCRYTVHLEQRDLEQALRILEMTTNLVMKLEHKNALTISGDGCE